jgi:hypothetical protein
MSDTNQTHNANHVVAVYSTHDQAEDAVRLLNEKGYDMRKLSVIGQNYHTDEQPVGFVNAGDRMWSWGKLGAFWGALWGTLFGSAMLFFPGVGYVLFAGWIVSILEGTVFGGAVGALVGALGSIGIPKDAVVRYESAIKAGSFVLIAHGDESETTRARDLLATTSHAGLESFAAASTPPPVVGSAGQASVR